MLQETFMEKAKTVESNLDAFKNHQTCSSEVLSKDITFVANLLSIEQFANIHSVQLETLEGLTGMKLRLKVA